MSAPLYKCILADPPWPESGGGRVKRGADRHYQIVKKSECPSKIVEIMLTAPEWRPDPEGAHLWLWVTNNYLADGLFTMKALGFRYVTNAVWAKDRFGLGQYLRGQHEILLFGVRGRQKALVRNRPSLIGGQQIPRTKHSRKPDEAYEMIEAISPGPRVEFFARERREGWDAFGNEVPKPDHVEALQRLRVQDKTREALDAARPHVYRQSVGGKHEQDKIDAKAWLERYGKA